MPPSPDPPAHITIKVKVPPGYLSTAENVSGTDSFVMGSQVPITANVGALRQQIQQLIPTHPPPERQRLLYGGRALVDNEQRLGDAFNIKRDPTQTEYVVHLLVKGEQGAGDGGPTHRRVVSTPSTPSPGAQQQVQAPQGRRTPFPIPGGPLLPHQQPFPQIIARNQQMRAGMGMQGVGGQQAQSQGQSQGGGQAEGNANSQAPSTQNAGQAQNTPQLGGDGQPQPSQHRQQVPGRPISGQGFHMHGVGPNGQHFQIHQQMMQFPLGGGMPGHAPFAFPVMGQFPGMMPGMGQPQPPLGHGHGHPTPVNGSSALDRARENMAEMRRVLEEMRNQNSVPEEQQRRIEEVQQRAQSLNEYIDPFQLGNAGNGAAGQRATPAQPIAPTNRSPLPAPFQQGLPPLYNAPRRPTVPLPPHTQQSLQRPSNPNEVTAYLLSSPQGPQALLFSPQHGAYTGSFAHNARPQPTPTVDPAQQQQTTGHRQHPEDPVAQAAHRAAQELQVQHAQLHAAQANQQAQAGQDPLGPAQAILAHFWLLFRILVFAYFFMGANMGWQRPLLMLVIGLGFYMVRAGALGDGAAVRRWWEGVVGVEQARRPQAEGAAGQQQGRPRQGEDGQQNDNRQHPGAMPTPEQVAQRLLNEQADRNQQQNAWWRERIRPVERAVALFVASLWPGVGEATVRARREMEERQRAEEEVERRRLEEEEKERAEREGQAEGGEKSTDQEGAKAESSAVESSAVESSDAADGLRERKTAEAASAADAQAASSSS